MRRVVLRAAAVVGALACAPAAGAWTWPAGGAVLRPFDFDPAHPYAGGEHRGIDVGGDAGSAVLAPAAGTVSFAGSVSTSGKSVTIQTPDGLSVTLTHLGSIGVNRNAVVTEGSSVGTIGPSGTPEAAEPYLHMGIRVTSEDQGYLDPLAFLPPRVGLPPPVPEADASSAEPAAEADAVAEPPVAEAEPAPAEPLAATANAVADSLPKPAPQDIGVEPGAAAESSVDPASPAEEPVDATTTPDPQPEPEAPPVEAASLDAAPVAVAEGTDVASASSESPPADAAPAQQEGSHSGPVAEPVAAPAVAAPAPAPVESADPAQATETVPAAETAPASVQPALHPTADPVAPAPPPGNQPASVDRPEISNDRRQRLPTQVQLVSPVAPGAVSGSPDSRSGVHLHHERQASVPRVR